MVDKTEFVFPDEQEEKNKGVDTSNEDAKISAKKSDDVEIEIVDDTPDKDRNRKPLDKEIQEPTQDELAAYSDQVKARINELTHARHDERRQREKLQREHEEMLRYIESIKSEKEKLENQLKEGTTTFATQSQKLAEVQLATAKSKLKAAHEAGDSEAFVEAQQEVASAVMALERAKYSSSTPLPQAQASDTVPTNAPTQPRVDPVKTAKATRWRNENPWFGFNKPMTALAVGVHNELVEKGYDTGSDEYYDTINKELRKRFPEAFSDSSQGSKPPATVVAPAGRSKASNKVVLTESQVSFANRAKIPLKEYARHVLLMREQNNGR